MEDVKELQRRYGMKQLQLEEAIEAQMETMNGLSKTVDLLRRLKSSEVSLEDVEVDSGGWSLK